MADQDGRHSEVITQLLRHVTSSTHDMEVKEDIFRRTIYSPSLVVIAFILESFRFGDENEYEYEFTGARKMRMRYSP